MRIRKYDFDYGRRELLRKSALGASAGVLAPLWPMVAHSDSGDISKAYPDELLSIEAYTKGKISVGDRVSAANVEHVKELLDPITYMQIAEQGREIEIVAPATDVADLYNSTFLDATLRNKGKAKLGEDGNVYDQSGSPWVGGVPFTDPQNGNEAISNLTLSWGRHDYAQYAIRQWDLDPGGDTTYQYDFVWAEMQVQARLDGTVFKNKKDLLRLQSVWFTAPTDTAGSSFLSTWYYDQRKYPDLHGYLPAFRRVRQFPTNQRFEPLLPGITWFLSDAWAAGDPMLTWGNYKIVGRQPMLGSVTGNWWGEDDNWMAPTQGGPKGKTFVESKWSMCPECIIIEAEPVGYPRAPVGKKRVWIDVRNHQFVAYVTYDRRGDIWKSFQAGWSQYKDGDKVIKDEKGNPDWSWQYIITHDVQANRVSRTHHTRTCAGGYDSRLDTGGVDVYNKFLTPNAISRLGTV